MIFSTPVFIFAFLPVVLGLYYLIRRFNDYASKLFLLLSSLFFYGFWKLSYLPILLLSLGVNYAVSRRIEALLARERESSLANSNLTNTTKTKTHAKLTLIFGLAFNIALLGVFKYTDFLFANLNLLFAKIGLGALPLPHFLLPLAISFFTFQQIAYLVDTHAGERHEKSFTDYALFVCFFPQLIAGPIVHHKEMMPQFAARLPFNADKFAKGIFIFAIGLFKKVCIADHLAIYANEGFLRAAKTTLNFFDSWTTSLSYTFQLYFDFSGYCDMATGLALLFGIALPANFNSPYKSLNIAEFWRRWHMTLGRFLRNYLYIPLGGNRVSQILNLRNLFVVAFISGIWHGAGWGFVIWGALHGLAMVAHRIYAMNFERIKAAFGIFCDVASTRLYKFAAWFLTFNFVNLTWVFFRAPDYKTAEHVIKGMFRWNTNITMMDFGVIKLLILSFFICFAFKNSIQIAERFITNRLLLIITLLIFYGAMFSMLNYLVTYKSAPAFLYFNF